VATRPAEYGSCRRLEDRRSLNPGRLLWAGPHWNLQLKRRLHLRGSGHPFPEVDIGAAAKLNSLRTQDLSGAEMY